MEVFIQADGRRVGSGGVGQFCLHMLHVLLKQFHLEEEEEYKRTDTKVRMDFILLQRSSRNSRVICVSRCEYQTSCSEVMTLAFSGVNRSKMAYRKPRSSFRSIS